VSQGPITWTKLSRLTTLVLTVVVLVAAGVVSPTVANASTGFARAEKVTAPTNASANPQAILYGVACVSAGNCTSVGQYTDNSNHQQALAATEKSGVWGRGTEVGSPGTAAHNPAAVLNAVSCTSAGYCTAVGNYTDGLNHGRVMAATETAGKWGRAVELGGTAPAELNGVKCTSTGNCVAVGSEAGVLHAIVITETSGKWGSAVAVTLPANAGTGSSAFALLRAVSCAAKGYCTAVGLYGGTNGQRYPMIVVESAGHWGHAYEYARLPLGASGAWADLLGVSCISSSSCTAVGAYEDASSYTWPMVATETGGTWGKAVKAALPTNANTGSGGPSSELESVSCTSAGNCAAFGAYNNIDYYENDMVAVESTGKWARATLLLSPTGSKGEEVLLGGADDAVSCAKTSCVAVGGYADSSYRNQAMAAAGTI
jgi:hypothetical protein